MQGPYQKKPKNQSNNDNLNQANKERYKQSMTNNTLTQLSRTYVEVDDMKRQKQEVYETKFQFDCKSVLHLWLAEILPGPKYNELIYNFQENKIKGDRKECRKKIQQCENFLQKHKMKLYQSKDLQLNQQLYLQKSLNIKIFRKKIIQKASQDLIKNYELKQLKPIISPILQKKYVCMMSILKKEQQLFLNIIQKIRSSQQITRSEIKQAQQERQKREAGQKTKKKQKPKKNNNFKSISESSFDISINFSKNDQSDGDEQRKQMSSDQDSLGQQEEQLLRLAKIAKKFPSGTKQKKQNNYQQDKEQLINKQRIRIQKQQIYYQEVDKNIFNVTVFNDWMKDNKKIDLNQVKIKQQNNKYIIIVHSCQNNLIKRQQMIFYFNFTKIIVYQGKLLQVYEQVKQLLQEINKNQIKSQCLQVFVKPKTKQQEINNLFRQKKLSMKKTKKNTQRVCLIHLSGIKANVQAIYNKIMNEQKQLIKQKQIITQIFNIHLGNLELYVYDKRVSQVIIRIITQILSKYKRIKIIDICTTPMNKITLNLTMNSKQRDQFINKYQVLIQKQVCQKIKIQDIMDEQQLNKQTSEKYILLPSKNDAKKIVLIQQKQKLMQSMKDILKTGQVFQKKQITIKNNRLPMLKQFIENIKIKQSKIMKNAQINYKAQDNCKKIQIYASKYGQKIYNLITQYLQRLDTQILEKTIMVSDFQASIIEKHMGAFQKKVQELHNLSFVLSKEIKIEALITLGPTREAKIDDPTVIYIYKQKCLSFLPKNTTFIFLSQYDNRYMHESTFKDVVQFFKGKKDTDNIYYMRDDKNKFVYTYYPRFNTVEDAIKACIKQSKLQNQQLIQKGRHENFALFMPKNKKIQFVKQVIKTFSQNYGNQKNKIFIIEHTLQNLTNLYQSLQEMNKLYSKTTQIKYFVKQGVQQLYFSPLGDKKIEQALSKGEGKIILFNSDLNLKESTHICSFKQQKLIHIKSKIQTNLLLYPDRVAFVLNGIEFQMPVQQVKKVEKNKTQDWVAVSIGAYQIDLKQNIQKNLFTGFGRRIYKKQIKIINPYGKLFLNIDLEHKINEVEVCYKTNQEKDAYSACELIKNLIQKQKIIKYYSLNKNFTEQKFQELQQNLKEFNIQMSWTEKSIKIQGIDKHIIEFALKKIQIMALENNKTITYPQYWCPQTKQVQIFVVPPSSKQYKDVQSQFAILPIKQLLRIQNKFVYQNYQKQKELLIRLNQGKPVKQMMLYHGTKQTDPKLIYQDKQQCFNVNYTSQNNFLGRAIYFAEKAVYSQSYQHTYLQNDVTVNCMFYCNVLIGDSEYFDKLNDVTKNLKNTNFKDQINKIRYQSTSLDTVRSKIYAVYKNRRAYPQYLIKY